MNDLISVIVPVYNAHKYIANCIRSIQKQTFPNWELILIDDGSTDKSGIICDTFAESDKRIKVIHQKNQGSISARRNGVQSASGAYICFSDADDSMPKNALEIMHKAHIQAGGVSIVAGRTSAIWNHLILPQKYCPPCFQIAAPVIYDHGRFINELYCSWFGISNLPVGLVAKLYPAKLLKDTFAAVPNVVRFMGDDLIMTLDVMPKAERIVVIPDVVYHYRPGGGTSKFQPKLMDDWLALYRFKRKYAERYHMPQPIKKLMDIELCNMTFTYFEMLSAHKKLSNEVIAAICSAKEVHDAANSPEINPSFEKAKLLREKNPSGISKYVELGCKGKVKQFMKKIYYKLA